MPPGADVQSGVRFRGERMATGRNVAIAALFVSGCSSNNLNKSHSQVRADPQSINFGNQIAGSKTTLPLAVLWS